MNNAFIARRIISTHEKYNSVNLRIFFKIESFTFFASISLQTTNKHTTKLTYSKIIVTWNILIRQTVLKWPLAFKYHRTYWHWLIFFCWQRGVFVFVFFVQGSQVMLCSTWYFRVYRVPIFRGYQELNNNIGMMCICGLYWCGSYNSC